jgi:hypothetical protein
MAHGTPDQVAALWAQRLGASTERIKQGIMATQVAPGQAAARQKAVWAQNVAASQDKWARNVARVSLQEWQDHAINKGVARIASGATAAEPKMTQFLARFLPYVDQQKASLPARGTLDQNIARSAQFIRAMSQFKNSAS